MTQTVSVNYVTQLQECLSLARDISQGAKAHTAFSQLRDRLATENPQAAELLDLLWNEFLAANRSAAFWQEMCDVEKELSERMAQSHFQLRQNYLRLMHEQ